MEVQEQVNQQDMDRLQAMFARQIVLQTRLGKFPLSSNDRQAYVNMMTIALIDEVLESLRETPFKDWKKDQRYNKKKCQEELIDVWHFLINLSLAAGMTADDVYKGFEEKNRENHLRQDGGY